MAFCFQWMPCSHCSCFPRHVWKLIYSAWSYFLSSNPIKSNLSHQWQAILQILTPKPLRVRKWNQVFSAGCQHYTLTSEYGFWRSFLAWTFPCHFIDVSSWQKCNGVKSLIRPDFPVKGLGCPVPQTGTLHNPGGSEGCISINVKECRHILDCLKNQNLKPVQNLVISSACFSGCFSPSVSLTVSDFLLIT